MSISDDTGRIVRRHVQTYRSRGRTFHYYRRGTFRVRLPDDAGSAEFARAWAEADQRFRADAAPATTTIRPGSVAALAAEYRLSPDFLGMKPKTRRDYERMLDELAPLRPYMAADIRRSHIVKLRAGVARVRGERSADLFVAVAGALFRVGLDLDYGLEVNPARDIRRLATPESYRPWPEGAFAAFEAAAAATGAPAWVLTGYMIGRHTAMRLGNVLRLSRAHRDGAGWDVRALKNEQRAWVAMPPPLEAFLAVLPVSGLIYVADANGRPLAERRFSGAFRDVCTAAGLDDLHFHGLRASQATDAAELGAGDAEIQAMLIHKTRAMAHRYSASAQQKRLAQRAVERIYGAAPAKGNV